MNPMTEVVSAPVILPFAHVHRYTDVHLDEYREEYSEELSETYVHPPLSLYPNLLDSATDLNTSLYQTNRIDHTVPLITKEDDTCFLWSICQFIINLLCCR